MPERLGPGREGIHAFGGCEAEKSPGGFPLAVERRQSVVIVRPVDGDHHEVDTFSSEFLLQSSHHRQVVGAGVARGCKGRIDMEPRRAGVDVLRAHAKERHGGAR